MRQTVRLIRATRDFEALPVFVFGVEDEKAERELLGAGATQVFNASQPLPLSIGEVVKSLQDAGGTPSPRPEAGEEGNVEIVEL